MNTAADLHSTKTDHLQDVRALVEQLLTGAFEARLQAAGQLNALAIKRMKGVLPRGSLTNAASIEFSSAEDQKRVIAALFAIDNPELLARTVSVLGKWGDETAAHAVCALLKSVDAPDIVDACIGALKYIGGPVAAGGLTWAADNGTENTRRRARSSIEQLRTGGTSDYTEGAVEGGQQFVSVSESKSSGVIFNPPSADAPAWDSSATLISSGNPTLPLVGATGSSTRFYAAILRSKAAVTCRIYRMHWAASVLAKEFDVELDPHVYQTKYAVNLGKFLTSTRDALINLGTIAENDPLAHNVRPTLFGNILRGVCEPLQSSYEKLDRLTGSYGYHVRNEKLSKASWVSRFREISKGLGSLETPLMVVYDASVAELREAIAAASPAVIFRSPRRLPQSAIPGPDATSQTDRLKADIKRARGIFRKTPEMVSEALEALCQYTLDVTQQFAHYPESPRGRGIEPAIDCFRGFVEFTEEILAESSTSRELKRNVVKYRDHVVYRQQKLQELYEHERAIPHDVRYLLEF